MRLDYAGHVHVVSGVEVAVSREVGDVGGERGGVEVGVVGEREFVGYSVVVRVGCSRPVDGEVVVGYRRAVLRGEGGCGWRAEVECGGGVERGLVLVSARVVRPDAVVYYVAASGEVACKHGVVVQAVRGRG